MLNRNLAKTIRFLNIHRREFFILKSYANITGHPVPSDSKYFSQILVSLLTEIRGIDRKKGADLEDNSDVKSALVWDAIDTPRFNSCLKAGTLSTVSDSMQSLDIMPHLYLVLWDNEPTSKRERCRIWVVRAKEDEEFRKICRIWYEKRRKGEIVSNNFQLHPPRNLNSDEIRNTCGNLIYPLFFSAIWKSSRKSYIIETYNPSVLITGNCSKN